MTQLTECGFQYSFSSWLNVFDIVQMVYLYSNWAYLIRTNPLFPHVMQSFFPHDMSFSDHSEDLDSRILNSIGN